jgi:hypothetical protein
LRYRAEKGDLLIEAGVGWKPGVVGNATLAVDYKSPAGRAFQTGAPVTIEDIRDTDEFRNPELLREHGIISIINVPVHRIRACGDGSKTTFCFPATVAPSSA